MSYANQGGLVYAYQDATGWYTETVDDGGSYSSLALDAGGYPHISYHSQGADLRYAYQDASGWHIQVVDSTGDVGKNTSLTLDQSGYPHIAYDDKTNGDVKYAYLGLPVAPVNVEIDGPPVGLRNLPVTFAASVGAITTTQPITYVWQGSGLAQVTHTGGLDDSVAFTWEITGTQLITVSASNSAGQVIANREIAIHEPVGFVYLPLVTIP